MASQHAQCLMHLVLSAATLAVLLAALLLVLGDSDVLLALPAGQ
jgi:hypothetical protein